MDFFSNPEFQILFRQKMTIKKFSSLLLFKTSLPYHGIRPRTVFSRRVKSYPKISLTGYISYFWAGFTELGTIKILLDKFLILTTSPIVSELRNPNVTSIQIQQLKINNFFKFILKRTKIWRVPLWIQQAT